MVAIAQVALLGLLTTSSVMMGAAVGLHIPFSTKLLAGVLAFAAGALIAALAIDLGFEGARELIEHGVNVHVAWMSIAGGFAIGAIVYYVASLFLDQKGAALRYPSRFLEYARARKRRDADDKLALLSKCDLLRHLPAESMEPLVERVQQCVVASGDIVFHFGEPGDALYIVADSVVEVLNAEANRVLAELGEGQAFGEMALLSGGGGTRTATIRAKTGTRLLRIDKAEFDRLLADDPHLEEQVRKLSHERAISNLHAGDVNPAVWAQMARESLDHVSRGEERRLMHEAKAGKGVGLAIVFGNILDTIPGCLVIGAKFVSLGDLSLTLIVGMFLAAFPRRRPAPSCLREGGAIPRARSSPCGRPC